MRSASRLSAIALAWMALCLGLFLSTVLPTLTEGIQWAAWFWRVSPGWTRSLPFIIPVHAASAGTVLLLALAGLTAGNSLLAWGGIRRPRGYAVALTAGLVLALPPLMLGLGLAGLFRTPLLVLVLAIPAAAGLFRISLSGLSASRWPWLAAGAVLLAPSLLCALVPEIQYDALQYHLALPRRFLEAGRIYLADPWPHANFHLAMETLFVPAIAIGGDGAAKLLNWLFFPLLLVLVKKAAKAAGTTGIAEEIPWLVIASSPLFSEVAGQTFTDCAASCAVTAAILLRLGPNPPALVIGALIGGAGAVKLPSMAYGLALLPFIAPRGKKALTAVGWVLPLIIWPMKSFLLTGTPFGGIALTHLWPSFLQGETCIDFLRSGNWTPPGHHSLWLTFPLLLLRGAVTAGFEFSPFLPALLPLALLPAAGRPPFLGRVVLASLALWPFTGGGQIRFLLPFIPAVLLAGTAGNRLDALAPQRLLRLLAFSAAALGLVRTSGLLFLIGNPVNAAIGAEDPRTYLARIITPTPIYLAAASRTGDNPRLGRPYVAGDIKSYYWPRHPRNDSQFLNPLLFRWARDSRGPRNLAAKFRQSGLGCVAHNLGGAITMGELAGGYPWSGRSLEVLQRFWAAYMSPVAEYETPGKDGWIFVWEFNYRGDNRFNPSLAHWLQIPYAEWITMRADIALDRGKLTEAGKEYRELARKWPRFAIIPLRQAELARRKGDTAEEHNYERKAVILLGTSTRGNDFSLPQ